MDLSAFNAERPRLFSIAYRMLGSASDAEDVLQDAWLRYQGADHATIRSPQAFTTTIVMRLCLDKLKSAREIAGMLSTTAANSRQLLHRARAKLAAGRSRIGGRPKTRRAVAERFARAFAAGDAAALTALLTRDATMWSDGGGKASAARRPLIGRDAIVNFLVGLHRTGEKAGLTSPASLSPHDVNAEPALVLRVGTRLEAIFVFSLADDGISGIRALRNPEKLAHIDRRLMATNVSNPARRTSH